LGVSHTRFVDILLVLLFLFDAHLV
jgi:hypothetical protein